MTYSIADAMARELDVIEGEKAYQAIIAIRELEQEVAQLKEIRKDFAERNGSRERTWLVEPQVDRVAHGVPRRVDRLRALGNSVVPQQAYPLFAAIAKAEGMTTLSQSRNFQQERP